MGTQVSGTGVEWRVEGLGEWKEGCIRGMRDWVGVRDDRWSKGLQGRNE